MVPCSNTSSKDTSSHPTNPNHTYTHIQTNTALAPRRLRGLDGHADWAGAETLHLRRMRARGVGRPDVVAGSWGGLMLGVWVRNVMKERPLRPRLPRHAIHTLQRQKPRTGGAGPLAPESTAAATATATPHTALPLLVMGTGALSASAAWGVGRRQAQIGCGGCVGGWRGHAHAATTASCPRVAGRPFCARGRWGEGRERWAAVAVAVAGGGGARAGCVHSAFCAL